MIGAGSLLPPHLQRPRTAPSGVILALREIDKDVELIHINGKIWWLGVVRPSPAMQERHGKAVERMLAFRNPPAERMLRAMLGQAGFIFIAEYEVDGEPTAAIVNDFRERDWYARHQLEEQWTARLNHEDAEKERAAADKLDDIRYRGRDAYMYALKKPVTLSIPAPATPTQENVP